ncbi:MAG: ankyrin repeat domain-containing protein [Wolbachia endosymbiont of Andrena nigroaenea]|nr:ankyrin repeat domain-containing protein [Wolbachia endosymbiont of Andrena nigroaenea]
MLKVGHQINYLKKEKISSETLEEIQHVNQLDSQRNILRFKRSDDNLKLPENFRVGQAIADGNCFFDSFRQELEQQLKIKVTVEQLRQYCKEFAQNNPPEWFINAIANSHDNNGAVRKETPDSYIVNILSNNRWGDSEVEGRILCEKYRVKLHIVEKHVVEGKELWLDQIVNSEGSRSVDSIDYNEENTIHIINRGNAHFEPILSTQEIQHNKQQSPDYDDEITPEEELINIIKSRDSEEEKLAKIKRLFEKEPKPDINFQGKDNGTPLHIAVRKKELKVIEWLVKNGAKIDIKNSRDRTSLDITEKRDTPNGQDIVQILKSHIQQVSVEEQPAKQERPNEENKLEDSDRKNQKSEQERLILYLKELPFDKDLKLSNGNFKSIIESDIKHVELNTADKLNFLNRPAYPDEYLLVHFASRVYKEREDGQELPDRKLPEGWKLLTTAYNQGATNHYFGAAYWNPDQQQIVIAHRGTDPSSTGALWTDIRGILQNNYVPQMNSAVTFANKIKTVLDEFNKKPNVNLQLFFTGHSLGGWLAQITTFTTKYFILEAFDESSFFVKSKKVGYHAHTVAFDSPGSKDMLSKIKSDFDLRHYKDDNSLSLSYLDITSYLSAPNLVNTCCSHLGTIYRVFIGDLPPERSSWDFAKYTKETHSIVKIEEALDPEKGNKLKAVIDWPLVKKGITRRALEKLLSSSHGILGVLRRIVFNQGESEQLPERNEYEYFHKLARDVSDYNPEPDDKEGYCTVRYQVQDVNKKKCSTRIFTQPELEFLRDYQKLRQFLTSPQLQDLFSSFNNENMVKKAIEALKNFKVEDRKKTVHCQSEKELDELITYVKNALYFFPDIKSKTKNVQTRKPIWFGVEDLVKSFIALTPGRQDTLDRIADDIKQGIVVISGLRGVGKTELAIKFARGKYSENEQGSAILIDAKDAENSFRILAKDKLKISCKDIDGGEKTINSMVDDVYDYFSNKRSLFIFDNAQRYIDIKKFLPLRLPPGASKPLVLITSDNLNKLEWPSSKVKIEELDKFQESESIKFIKTSLGVSDDSQGKSIKDLANKLYHFPLLLEYAVRDIKRYQEGNQNFKIGDYNSIIDEYIERLNLGLTPHNDVLAELLRIRLDQIRQEEYGERALKIAHVMAYCASQNLPKGIFSDSDDEIGLLQQYSILKQGSINMHELVQRIIRSELQNQPLEEETLKQVLNLFKGHMKEPDSVEHYESHIISVWNYASKYDKLIEDFITNADYNESDFTTYLHLIVEKSSNDVASKVLNSISHDKLEQIINVKKKDQKTLLHCAALGGNKSIVRLLINKEASIDARDQIGNTPLHLAAKNGYLVVVNILLDSEAKVNSETQQKFTPLHLAAKENHLDIINALLAKKANINAQTKQKFTPLHFAAQNGHLEVVNALLDKGAKVKNFDVEYKITPLHLAAEGDHIEVIKALLGKKGKADINAKTPKKTPLMWAARKGRVKAVRELLRREADIVFKNDKGETALNLAAKGDHWETALVLFNGGARLDELSLDQYLSFVCFHLPEDKFETEYRKLYSDKDKPIYYLNDQRRNKFYYKDGRTKVNVEKSDINQEKRKKLYLNALSKIEDSIQKGDTDKLKKLAKLISKIVEIEKKDKHGNVFLPESLKDTNLIVLACEHNNLEVLEYLLDGQNAILGNLSTDIKKAINPGDIDGKGHNAFYYAIRSGNVELLGTLINKWPDDYFSTRSKELDETLSKAYDELKLKNVPLSEEIEVFVQDKLINLRFFYEKDSGKSADENQSTLEDIKKRIDMVVEGINSLKEEYSGAKEVDGEFLYSSTFITKNIRILKRQLPFTYDKLPWEEIEFSLTSFISSYTKDQEINFVFKTILDKQKLLDYLSAFKNALSEQKDTLRDEDLDRELPSTQRRNIVDNVICSNPTFSGLYDDYEQMRDIYSLKQIEHYINLVLSDNIEEEIKQHVIERALQVTGEYLKSTLTSPNMSSTLSGLIIQSVSESTSKVLTSLRNSLSHSYSLASRMKIAASRSPEFLSNIQNDLKKIGEKIIDIFYKNKVEEIRTLLSKIANSNSLDEMKEIAKVLEDVQFDEINLEKIKIKEHENVKRLIGDLSNYIKDKTDYQKELFDKINEILELEENKLTNAKVEYSNKLYTLEEVISMVRSGNIKTMKTLVQCDLKNFLKRDQDKQEKIADLVVRIANSKTHSSLVNELVYNVFYTDQFALGRASLIEEFNEKLKREGDKGTRRATIEEKQAKLDGIFGKILREKLNLQEDKLVEIIEEFKSKGREVQERFFDAKEELLSILDELVKEESQGEEEIKSKIRIRYKDGGYENLIDGSCLEKKDKDMLKGSLTRTKKLYKLIEEEQGIKKDIKSVYDKITEPNVKSKVINIFEDLVTQIKENKAQVKLKAKEKQEEFKSLLDILQDDQTWKKLIINDYESNNLNSVRSRVEKSNSDYEEFLGLIDHINQDSVNKISQLFNKFSQLLTMESNQKEKLNESFKKEIEETLKSSSVISQKLFELESILDKNGLNSKLIEKFSSYKVTQKLQAIVEMLVLDITEVLNAKGLLAENRYFLDKSSSILIGKQLRNYLAHGDPLINALSFDTLMSIISNARTFVEKKDIIIGGKKLIGQVIEDDPFSLEEQHKQNLKILNIQKKMFSAAEEGNIDKVKDYIRKGADVNARDINGWNALHYAAREDKLDVTKFFLDQNLSIDTKNNKGETPLHIAACFGSKGIIRSFVKYKDPDVNHLLCLAAGNGYKEIVDILLDNKGADVNKPTDIGAVSLHFAAKNGHKDVVDTLLKAGIEVNTKTTDKGWTPLHYAAQNGHKDVVDALLKVNGIEVNAKGDTHWTPLHAAAQNGHKDVVDALLKVNGIEINAKTTDEDVTPLHLAVHNGHKEVVEALLNKKADIFARNDCGTVLHLAVVSNNIELIRFILDIIKDKDPQNFSEHIGAFMLEFNSRLNAVLGQPIQQILHNENSTLRVSDEQINSGPQSYLSNTSIQGHLTQARDLSLN